MMDPYPNFCLICGAEIAKGIHLHITGTHKMDFTEYCKYFPDIKEGSYNIFTDKKGRKVLTITRIVEEK